MSVPHVELICDGSPAVGFGHVRRMLTLAEELRAMGIRVVISALSANVRAFLPVQTLVQGLAKVIVFDVPGDIDELIRRARNARQTIFALDWFGAEEPDIAIVIHAHRAARARRGIFVGWDYQMIRTEITAQPRGIQGEGVIVILGGGDLLGQGQITAQQLSKQGLAVTLVQGPLSANFESSMQYKVVVNPPDLARRLAECEWMVTNGGSCMFEAMYLGKATVVLPQTEAETVLARVAMERGSLLGIGAGHLRPYTPKDLEPVARRAAEIIDGRGAERVAAIIKEHL
jgi:spore coat polysaccharide biosynthesis predicted glycosyltransferase SpsG